MSESSNRVVGLPGSAAADVLTSVLRSGAQRLLVEAIEAEVSCWIADRQHLTNAAGQRQVVRNGYAPRRTILTGLGPVEIAQPRVLDRRLADEALATLVGPQAAGLSA